jgi:hypothetical protein
MGYYCLFYFSKILQLLKLVAFLFLSILLQMGLEFNFNFILLRGKNQKIKKAP